MVEYNDFHAPIVTVKDLCKTVGKRTLWSEISLEFAAGESYAITGPSGSGKTTLLNVLGGLEPYSEGDVRIHGQSLSQLSHRKLRALYRSTIGFLFQNYALVEQWTVSRNLRLAVRSTGVRRSETDTLIDDALHAVGMADTKDSPVFTLSGGEQQRVALARLLAHSPSIVLADEPTAALDTRNEDLILHHLSQLRDNGTLIICATHSGKVAAWADHVIEL